MYRRYNAIHEQPIFSERVVCLVPAPRQIKTPAKRVNVNEFFFNDYYFIFYTNVLPAAAALAGGGSQSGRSGVARLCSVMIGSGFKAVAFLFFVRNAAFFYLFIFLPHPPRASWHRFFPLLCVTWKLKAKPQPFSFFSFFSDYNSRSILKSVALCSFFFFLTNTYDRRSRKKQKKT